MSNNAFGILASDEEESEDREEDDEEEEGDGESGDDGDEEDGDGEEEEEEEEDEEEDDSKTLDSKGNNVMFKCCGRGIVTNEYTKKCFFSKLSISNNHGFVAIASANSSLLFSSTKHILSTVRESIDNFIDIKKEFTTIELPNITSVLFSFKETSLIATTNHSINIYSCTELNSQLKGTISKLKPRISKNFQDDILNVLCSKKRILIHFANVVEIFEVSGNDLLSLKEINQTFTSIAYCSTNDIFYAANAKGEISTIDTTNFALKSAFKMGKERKIKCIKVVDENTIAALAGYNIYLLSLKKNDYKFNPCPLSNYFQIFSLPYWNTFFIHHSNAPISSIDGFIRDGDTFNSLEFSANEMMMKLKDDPDDVGVSYGIGVVESEKYPIVFALTKDGTLQLFKITPCDPKSMGRDPVEVSPLPPIAQPSGDKKNQLENVPSTVPSSLFSSSPNSATSFTFNTPSVFGVPAPTSSDDSSKRTSEKEKTSQEKGGIFSSTPPNFGQSPFSSASKDTPATSFSFSSGSSLGPANKDSSSHSADTKINFGPGSGSGSVFGPGSGASVFSSTPNPFSATPTTPSTLSDTKTKDEKNPFASATPGIGSGPGSLFAPGSPFSSFPSQLPSDSTSKSLFDTKGQSTTPFTDIKQEKGSSNLFPDPSLITKSPFAQTSASKDPPSNPFTSLPSEKLGATLPSPSFDTPKKQTSSFNPKLSIGSPAVSSNLKSSDSVPSFSQLNNNNNADPFKLSSLQMGGDKRPTGDKQLFGDKQPIGDKQLFGGSSLSSDNKLEKDIKKNDVKMEFEIAKKELANEIVISYDKLKLEIEKKDIVSSLEAYLNNFVERHNRYQNLFDYWKQIEERIELIHGDYQYFQSIKEFIAAKNIERYNDSNEKIGSVANLINNAPNSRDGKNSLLSIAGDQNKLAKKQEKVITNLYEKMKKNTPVKKENNDDHTKKFLGKLRESARKEPIIPS